MAERLEYAGFHKHRAGRIHVYCPHCKLKRSNVPRDEYDPPTAVLVAIVCESCGDGCKIEGPEFFRDADGREVCSFCGTIDCDKVGGRKDCTERLVELCVAEEWKP